MTTSNTRLEQIRKRVEAATDGPWTDKEDDSGWLVASIGTSALDDKPYCVYTGRRQCSELDGDAKTDAEFIAHAREDVPFLLARIERLEAALKTIQEKDGYTMLGNCCVDKTCRAHGETEKGFSVACTHQYGVSRGYKECASIARAALEGKE